MIFHNQEAFVSFSTGKLKGTKSIEPAKYWLPMIGRLYGYMSNSFVHINDIDRLAVRSLRRVVDPLDRPDPDATWFATLLKGQANLVLLVLDVAQSAMELMLRPSRMRYWEFDGVETLVARMDPKTQAKTDSRIAAFESCLRLLSEAVEANNAG